MTAVDTHLIREQYRSGANLGARIALHARFSTAARNFLDWLFDRIEAGPDARILEIGCGTGALWRIVRSRVPRAWSLTLSDFSPGMVAESRALLTSLALPASFTQTDAQALPFLTTHFDAVIANHMLYHLPDVSLGLSEIRRVLKPGGRLYAATNGQDHMRELDDLARDAGVALERPLLRLPFNLENGAQLLSAHFGSVARYDFPDGLHVTEAEPLVAYVKSMSIFAELFGEAVESRLRALAAERIARDGAIHITKAVGLFVATA
ncbi:MAG: class I SAM-dependent methyltransferase [Chloroflexi bacterium]|nr:class I SAM-dependent methyltransferase [Chloroflexota bacterium]MBI3732874.1 class I SAM-dependent methyltransferase [Chloroflexota bacterium]